MSLRKRPESSQERKPLQSRHSEDDQQQPHEKSDITGDVGNIAILFFLYLLQGIPLGVGQAIPMLLQNRGASYKEQAEFSFAYWPFSSELTQYCAKTQKSVHVSQIYLSYDNDE